MSLRIIVHCYAEKLPQYATFLRAQLSSLAVNQPRKDVKITVCFAASDKETRLVLHDFQDLLEGVLQTYLMEVPYLCRRSIGRSRVGKASGERFTMVC